MRKLLVILLFIALYRPVLSAQDIFTTKITTSESGDIFVPISKYIETGEHDKLAAWFADTLEIDLMGTVKNTSRQQAQIIMKDFFEKYNPKGFSIIHKSGRPPMSYAVGSLETSSQQFRIIIFVKAQDGKNAIQQIRIEKQH